MKNRNMIKALDPRYVQQQKAINVVCNALNLIPYYPNYHADKTDKNTVIIYTKEGHAYNETLPDNARVDEEKGRVGVIENRDPNGRFDLDYINGERKDGPDGLKIILNILTLSLRKMEESR